MLLQAGIVAVRDYWNETDFQKTYVRREATLIAREFRLRQDVLRFKVLAKRPAHYFGPHAEAYAFRVVDANGAVLAQHNGARIETLSPLSEKSATRQDFWVRKLDANKRMHVAGGLKVRRDDRDFWVEGNMKETDLTRVHTGQPVAVKVDTYPDCKWSGTVEAIAAASGSAFSPLPAQNTSGNWVKVVQRIPVRVKLDPNNCNARLSAGMSALVTIDTGQARWQRLTAG